MSEVLDRLARRYLDTVFETFPSAATAYGAHEHDARLEDLTPAALDEHARRLRALLGEVRAVQAEGAEEAADRDALAATIAEGVLATEVERPLRRNPYEAATLIPNALLLLIARDFAPLDERLAAATARLEAAPRLLEQAKVLLDEPCPALWRRMGVSAARSGAAFLDSNLPSFAAGRPVAARLGDAAARAADALRGFAAWLEEEHARRFPEDAPFAAGEAVLARKLREVHCLDITPAGVAALGQAQIAEVTEALQAQAAQLGASDWASAYEELKAQHPTGEALLGAYRDEVERLKRFVLEHGIAPDPEADTTVEATPEYLRGTLAVAAYLPAGPFDAYQQGHFWVTPPDQPEGLRDHCYAVIPPIAAHEAWPGHHLQMTIVNRLDSVARKALRSDLMVEGWGLYTEQLMHDAGYYRPEARLAQLAMRLLRALRIELDVGLHTGELSFDEAVARAVTVARLSEPGARGEVARYTMTPTQPLSYLVGCLELERLRAGAERRLGAAFRLRDFHEQVLAYGHMPPALVARALTAGSERCTVVEGG